MPLFQAPAGTRDILPPDSGRWRRFVSVFADVVEPSGYGQIILPMFEDLGVFQRVGESTDLVTKEMYAFTDRDGTSLTLRPEAGVDGTRALRRFLKVALRSCRLRCISAEVRT